MRRKDFYRWRREQVNKQKVEWDKAGAEPVEKNDTRRLNDVECLQIRSSGLMNLGYFDAYVSC